MVTKDRMLLKTSYGWGAVLSSLDEKGAQSKLPATQAQNIPYAYYWYIWKENTLTFLKRFE